MVSEGRGEGEGKDKKENKKTQKQKKLMKVRGVTELLLPGEEKG
jgi:hypothetical protein